MKLEYSKPPLTEAEFDAFIAKWDIAVPESYRTIMLECNGGVPEKPYYDSLDLLFLPIGYSEIDVEFYLKDFIGHPLYSNMLVFAVESGETNFMLGVRGEELGKVYISNDVNRLKKVEDSFEEFMSKLEEESQDAL